MLLFSYFSLFFNILNTVFFIIRKNMWLLEVTDRQLRSWNKIVAPP